MKKLNYEFVKEKFEEVGYTLLEDHYVNSRDKMRYRCTRGHKNSITFRNFNQGRRCRKCGHIDRSKKRRRTIESTQEFFKSKGCELLEKEYVNNKTPILYRCECGRVSKICFSSFSKGRRCKDCGLAKIRGWVGDDEELLFRGKMRVKYKNILRNALKYTGQKKCARTHEMLGYLPQQFKEHLTSHPNWEKVKDGKWHVDHIFPIKAFLDYKIYDMKIINSLDNLQPLSETDNLRKHASFNEYEFRIWLGNRGITI